MPTNDKEKQREWSKKHYQKHRATIIAKVAENKRRAKDEWWAFKATLSCTRCGAAHPAIIDFHHPVYDGTKQDVNQLLQRGSFRKAREEAAKCEVLCANCHRIHHYHEYKNIKILDTSQSSSIDS